MDNSLENVRQALYASIRSFIDALEAADAISDACFKETPEEKELRTKAEVKAITKRIFGDD